MRMPLIGAFSASPLLFISPTDPDMLIGHNTATMSIPLNSRRGLLNSSNRCTMLNKVLQAMRLVLQARLVRHLHPLASRHLRHLRLPLELSYNTAIGHVDTTPSIIRIIYRGTSLCFLCPYK